MRRFNVSDKPRNSPSPRAWFRSLVELPRKHNEPWYTAPARQVLVKSIWIHRLWVKCQSALKKLLRVK